MWSSISFGYLQVTSNLLDQSLQTIPWQKEGVPVLMSLIKIMGLHFESMPLGSSIQGKQKGLFAAI